MPGKGPKMVCAHTVQRTVRKPTGWKENLRGRNARPEEVQAMQGQSCVQAFNLQKRGTCGRMQGSELEGDLIHLER